ncbi:MAG: hypothetical protein DRN37_08850 [Thermoplasmata archaeon]|nr:MAG: hypothetical protein DRN37_08850 [Thermoplasmata archaeon]
MTHTAASIDIGSHTARLLVAIIPGPGERLRPLARKRAYIRLAEDFDGAGQKIIRPEAFERTVTALEDFLACAHFHGAQEVRAVTTGVAREAANRAEFLRYIQGRTGVRVRVITGEEEARLSGKGVLYALRLWEDEALIFDLGGGTTEFLFHRPGGQAVKSIPLGALVLKQSYLECDPPQKDEILALSAHVDQMLDEAGLRDLWSAGGDFIVGTGGTVTALAAMVKETPAEEIDPEKLNGVLLKRNQIKALFNRIKGLALEERQRLPGLDAERAEVIPAGILIVLRIMHYFGSMHLQVCLSDLLDGILMDDYEGERNE